MIHVYNKSNMSLLYLSPYIDVKITEDYIMIRQMLFDKYVSLQCKADFSKSLMDTLADGADENELISFLSDIMPKNKAEEILNLWIGAGVLE